MPSIPRLLFVLFAFLYLAALCIDTMDVDASQYARISSEMLQSGHYLQLYEGGKPYLDKPPFLFWISSFGMWLFGFNNLGYKLPSIVFALMAIYATYRFARVLYNHHTAMLAAMILASSQAMFLMTNDIRTDTVLMSWVILSLWCWKEWEVSNKWKWHLAAFGCMALGMMSKGPIALIAPLATMGAGWLMKQKWSRIFNAKHLVGIAFMTLLLLPMSIGLYMQYDRHPELMVNGKTGVSGLRFFYWTQSFGRITGENVWNNGAPFSFLFENMLWAFLPWTLLFVAAFIYKLFALIRSIKSGTMGQEEWHTFFGFTLVYIMLGLSKYQLPHYLFVVYPLAAVLTASFIQKLFVSYAAWARLRIFALVQTLLSMLMIILALLMVLYVFPQHGIVVGIAAILFVGLIGVVYKRFDGNNRWLYLSIAAAFLVNVVLTVLFYPSLLRYQASSNIGRYLKSNTKSGTPIYQLNYDKVGTYFYAQRPLLDFAEHEQRIANALVITDSAGISQLQAKGFRTQLRQAFAHYSVSILTPKFLNPKTRPEVLDSCYVVQVGKPIR